MPPAPAASNGQVIFFFDGKECCSPTYILQPVLEWNWNGSGIWQISSWYAGDSNYGNRYSQIMNGNVGDTAYGVVKPYSVNGYWVVNTYDIQQSESTSLLVWSPNSYNWKLTALETYYVTACNQYPGRAVFNAESYYGFPYLPILDWSISQSQTGCGLNTQVEYLSGNDYVEMTSAS